MKLSHTKLQQSLRFVISVVNKEIVTLNLFRAAGMLYQKVPTTQSMHRKSKHKQKHECI